MNMKKMIQQMTDLENSAKQELTESRRIAECPPDQVAATPIAAPASEGTPVSVNVNMTASGKEHVNDLLSMMKAAGLDKAEPMKPNMMPMRQDMDRLRDIVDEPEMEADEVYADKSEDDLEEYENEPDYHYDDHEKMTHDLSGGINRRKKSYSDAEDGDNAMAVQEAGIDPEQVRELVSIKDLDKLKNTSLKMVKGSSMNPKKKMTLMRNIEKSRTPDNVHGALWNAILKKDKLGAIGSNWDSRHETIEDEMRENIKSQLLKSLEEKKAKPDYIDIDGDGDKKEPMKKAAKDKKKKVPPQFQKKK